MEIIREGNDLIWADVRNVFLIQSRIRLWWPGRVSSLLSGISLGAERLRSKSIRSAGSRASNPV